jgi:hypothetical protein
VQPQRWLAFCALLVIATLSACSSAGGFLLYFDPYEFEVLDGQGINAAAIRQSFPTNRAVRIEVSPLLTEEAKALRQFGDAIERARPGWVFVSSAHPFDPGAVIPLYPDIRFFREGSDGEVSRGTASANQIALVYDRERADYEAGRAIAALLGDADFRKRIGVAGPGSAPPRVGILSAVDTEPIRREIEAFINGFSEFEDPGRIELREIGNLTDRVKARRLLDGMREEAVAIVLLKTYVLSGFCLEYLAKETGVAIVEGPIPDQAYGDTVLLALVDDFIGALEQMAEIMDQAPPAGTVEPVNAPVLLRWNESYRPVVNRVLEEANQRGMERK